MEWAGRPGRLRVAEPTPEEASAAAGPLAAFYNDVHNRAMLANTVMMSVEDVRAHYDALWDAAGRPLLLLRDGVLLGDADLRGVAGASAEFAILIGPRASQGQGLGTAFAILAHALAFRMLPLACLYVSIVPDNVASRRLFEKVGYQPDDGPAARAIIDADSDLTLSITREAFAVAHGVMLRDLRFTRDGAVI